MRARAAHDRLRDGRAIPQLGLGVFQIPPGEATQAAVEAAWQRAIGTWTPAPSKADVGAAIRASGLARSVWVTTTLANADQGAATARRAFEASLERLGLDAVDLYLLHWPHADCSSGAHPLVAAEGLRRPPTLVELRSCRRNAAVFGFALDSAQMARLDALDEALTTAWDPAKQAVYREGHADHGEAANPCIRRARLVARGRDWVARLFPQCSLGQVASLVPR